MCLAIKKKLGLVSAIDANWFLSPLLVKLAEESRAHKGSLVEEVKSPILNHYNFKLLFFIFLYWRGSNFWYNLILTRFLILPHHLGQLQKLILSYFILPNSLINARYMIIKWKNTKNHNKKLDQVRIPYLCFVLKVFSSKLNRLRLLFNYR